MSKLRKPNLPLQVRLEAAEQVAVGAKHFHEIWDHYKRERSSLIKTMRRFEDFFARDIQAHFFAFVVTIYLLQDSKSGVNFQELIKELESELSHDGRRKRFGALRKARAALTQVQDTAGKFRILRNNVVAHMNRHDTPGAWFKEADLTYDEVANYCDTMLKVAHLLLDAHDPSAFELVGARTYRGERSPLPDVKQLFAALERGVP